MALKTRCPLIRKEAVIKKIKKADDDKGNHYLFGTKCILVTAMDGGDILVVKEEKSHGEMDFQSYISKNRDAEWNHIKRMLKTTHANLQSEEDPVKALGEVFEKIWLKELEK